ncbi:MAG: molecular chaperone DnaJ [Candidatus Methanoplasma sp.]|jgi:molecular chaperone DnaJ|nr:molecular chaperone DnaJ [Candidatus Methanoplasma sp.]
MPRDYYETLGIQKGASPDEIKRAYRQMAKKYHPDVSTESKEVAEAKFKELSEAYEVLSDPDKRQTYDQYGHDGVKQQFSGGGGFSWNDFTHAEDVSDIFGDLFGNMFGGSGGRRGPVQRNSPSQGESLRYDLEVDLREVFHGKNVEISVPHTSTCPDCGGNGGKDGKVETCRQCNGQGQVQRVSRTPFGNMVSVSDCPECRGTGRTSKERCPKCRGSGHLNVTSKVTVNIPKGIEDGSRIRVPRAGDAGRNGGSPGDLIVVVHVRGAQDFKRDGADLWTTITTTYPRLVLGGEETISTIDGETISLAIPPGTQVGGVLRVLGKGLPKMNLGTRGNMFVRVMMDVPQKVSAEEKEILLRLDDSAGKKVKPKARGRKKYD